MDNDIKDVIDVIGGNVNAGNGGGTVLYRLREGIERFLITDINNTGSASIAQSSIFIMWDTVATDVSYFNHVPGGSNVLYMDGHVEFLKYTPQGAAPVLGAGRPCGRHQALGVCRRGAGAGTAQKQGCICLPKSVECRVPKRM
jgi:prepilin-type processing-associated H-X9-DG protein